MEWDLVGGGVKLQFSNDASMESPVPSKQHNTPNTQQTGYVSFLEHFQRSLHSLNQPVSPSQSVILADREGQK